MTTIAPRLLTSTVTVVHPAVASDRYGNAVDDWASATRTDYAAWLEARGSTGGQASGSEDTDNRDQLASVWLCLMAPDAMVDGRDRVEFGAYTFEVVGPPQRSMTLRGAHHLELTLRWVEG